MSDYTAKTTLIAVFLLFVLGMCRLHAQTPTITDFHTTPDIQTATVPGLHCDVFAQHPAARQMQVACYLGTTLVGNMVFTVGSVGFVCSAVTPSTDIGWAFVPATSPMIGYQLAAEVHNQGPPLVLGTIVSTSPTTAVAGGTF